MAGLLNAQAPQAGAGAESLSDPILQQIERGIEAEVPPELKKSYLAIVVAGMRVMYDPKTSHMMDQQLQSSGDVVTNVSEGIAKLIGLLRNEGKGGFSDPAAPLAALSLMAQALDYAERKFGVSVTPELAAECTKATIKLIPTVLGISQDAIDKHIASGQQGGAQQPAAQPAGV